MHECLQIFFLLTTWRKLQGTHKIKNENATSLALLTLLPLNQADTRLLMVTTFY